MLTLGFSFFLSSLTCLCFLLVSLSNSSLSGFCQSHSLGPQWPGKCLGRDHKYTSSEFPGPEALGPFSVKQGWWGGSEAWGWTSSELHALMRKFCPSLVWNPIGISQPLATRRRSQEIIPRGFFGEEKAVFWPLVYCSQSVLILCSAEPLPITSTPLTSCPLLTSLLT